MKNSKRMHLASAFLVQFFFTAFYTIPQVYNLYIAEDFGLGLAEIGTLVMLQSLPSTIIPLLLGRAADKFGKKQMIVGGLVLYIVGGLMMVAAKTVGLYTAGLLINAVGIAMGYGSNGPAIADNFPDKAGRYISWIEASGCVAQTLVPLIAVAIGVTWRPMYLMVSVLAVIPMLIICFVRIPKYSSADPANTGSNSRAKITLSLIILSFAMLFYCGMDATYASFVDAFFVDQRNIATHGSIALTLHGALYAVSRFLTGLIKKGEKTVIRICLAVSAASLGMILLIQNPDIDLIFCAVFSFFAAPVYPLYLAQAARDYPENSAEASSLLMAGSGIGCAIMAWAVGFVGESAGMTAAMIMLIVSGVFSLLCYIISEAMGKKQKA